MKTGTSSACIYRTRPLFFGDEVNDEKDHLRDKLLVKR